MSLEGAPLAFPIPRFPVALQFLFPFLSAPFFSCAARAHVAGNVPQSARTFRNFLSL